MSIFLSKEFDDYINVYADKNPLWIATLSNGEQVYQDDGREGIEPASAWVRLKQYCSINDLYIESIKLRNKSHIEELGSGHDGYFFCKSAGALLFGDMTQHSFVFGTLTGEKLSVRKWRLPELVPESVEERDPYENPEFIIAKKGILNEQRLQAQNDRSGM
tara:strand:+ start:1088 stop:1570 length:483 start_codon:yes stop_codon:yes gene_type:complete